MKIKENPNIVIAGAWNLNILTPKWFAQEFPDLAKQKEVLAQVQIGTGILKFSIDDRIKINPNPDKLIFFSEIAERSNYELVEKLAMDTVSKLRHTPITALGHNVTYFLDEGSFSLFNEDSMSNYEDYYKKELSITAFNTQQILHTLSYENYLLNLTYNINRQKNFVSFNYHYNVTDAGRISEFISEFKNNINNSEEIFKKIVVKK